MEKIPFYELYFYDEKFGVTKFFYIIQKFLCKSSSNS